MNDAARSVQSLVTEAEWEQRVALAACYREIGNNLKFEDGTIDRGGALGLWYELEDPARRKALHDAFLPLWSALNGNNEPDSPYRRLIKMAANVEATNGSGPAAAARAGASPGGTTSAVAPSTA